MIRIARITLALLATAVVTAHAQSAGTGVPAPAYMADSLRLATPAPADSLVPAAIPPTASDTGSRVAPAATLAPSRPHVLAIRSDLAIRAERDQMRVLADGAADDLSAAKRARAEVHGAIERTKLEIDALGARIKAAKQAGDAATRAALEDERRRRDSVRSYFERLQDVHEGTLEEARARGEYARASVRACDLELQLSGRSGVTANDGDPSLFRLEQQYIDAVKARGAAAERSANRLQVLADRELRLYRAWADWLGGR